MRSTFLDGKKRGVIRRNPELRNPIDSTLVYDVAKTLVDSIDTLGLTHTDLTARMHSGKLIGRI